MNRSLNHEFRDRSARVLQGSDGIWAVLPGRLAEIDLAMREWLIGPYRLTAEEARKNFGATGMAAAAAARSARAQGTAVAVIPVFGVISQRADIFSDFFGGTPVDRLTKSFRAALADPSIKAIVLDVDSPGGNVAGVPELAAEIYAARNQKKEIIAVADSMAASAAYWLASAADEFVAAPSAEVGSIGVYAMHLDYSKLLEMDGVAATIITSGAHKAEGNPYQPLSQDAKDFLQKRVDEYGDMFVRAVGQGRGVSMKTVRESFGQGRMFGAAEALNLGMIDHVQTLDEVLAGLGVGAASASAMAAQATACAVCAGSGCVLAAGENGEPKLTNELCPGCNGSGLPVVNAWNSLAARARDIEIQREQLL